MNQAYSETVTAPEDIPLGQVWPNREGFRRRAATQRVVPVLVRYLADEDTPISLFRKLTAQGEDPAGPRGTFLLESAGDSEKGRWSIIGARARAVLTEKDGCAHWIGDVPTGVPTEGDPLEALRLTAEAFHSAREVGLPPFTGGLVGYLGYDIVRRFEKLGPAGPDEIGLPDLCLVLSQDLAIYDHRDATVVLVANALNLNGTDDGADAAYDDAVARLRAMTDAVRTPVASRLATYTSVTDAQPRTRTSREDYERSVQDAIKDIVDGEIFQVVPSQRFTLDSDADALDIYRVLRRMNPSPYMYLLRLVDAEGRPLDVVGASPESLVTVRAGTATTHPIAGSRPRGRDDAEDRAHAKNLVDDPKERSEHLMLVDLARNDLQKFCRPGSVTVHDFMHIERYSHIMHLVSTVTGEMEDDATAFDALRATFPAGTLSGAPKPRAMQIIDRLEPVARGLYGGTVGYIDFAGDMDMAIAIRTAVIADGSAHVQAGGGVVADSSPTMEYRESVSKAAAALRAVVSASTMHPVTGLPDQDGDQAAGPQ
ncbi:anthranilate synthase component I [Devriesea agamarum]|uniref:anthranilate synthase component I n=1 Tax=Devriesea agamarum TaxID=472569 RepID=UPI00071C78FE|nr:anthranilate synthase component I [Devriesea agamarum]